jgi:hypothetical protein
MQAFELKFTVNFSFGLDNNNQLDFIFKEDVLVTDIKKTGTYGAEEAMRLIKNKYRGSFVRSVQI